MKKVFLLAVFFGWMHLAGAVDYFSPRISALGGAGKAGPIGTDAIFLNPSITSFQKSYAASASYNKFSGRDDGEPRGHILNGSILDGTNDFFQAGIGYTTRPDATLLHFGAAKALTQWLGLGIGAKRFYDHPGRANSNQFSASTVLDLATWLKVAFVADNLNENADSKGWNLYREYGAGLKVNLQNILIFYYDPSYTPHRDGKKYGSAMAAELMLFQGIYARFGLNRDVMQPHLGIIGNGIGYGLGMLFPKLSLDFALYRSMAPVYTDCKLASATISF